MGTFKRVGLKGRNPYAEIKRGIRADLNIFVRSSWEANWARWLNLQIDNGLIKDWEYEPKEFVFEKIKRGTRTYLPDFRVTNNDDSIEYHEVKGWMDSKSKTKLKRMKQYYPDVKVILVDAKQYKAVERKAKGLISNWE
jgi:hypothetical protein